MAQYLLLSPHIIGESQMWLPRGTVIGTNSDFPFDATPSNQMAGLDADGKAAVDQLHNTLYGRPPPWGDVQADLAASASRAEEEASSEPVSYSQAYERGLGEYKGKAVTDPLPPSPLAMSLSGDQSHTFGEIVGSTAAPTTRF